MTSKSETKVIFYAFPKTDDIPSFSGFCQKVETFLRYAKVTYESRPTSFPDKAPKHKLPYVEVKHNGTSQTIPDSHFIIKHLIEKGIAPDPDAGLTALEKAESRVWQAYAEGIVSDMVGYERWLVPANIETFTSGLFEGTPRFLVPIVKFFARRKTHAMFWTMGIGRHSFDEVKALGQEAIDNLAARLEGKMYFHGERFTTVDAVLYGFLVNVLGNRASPQFFEMVREKTVLVAYVQRITTELFPEYEKILKVTGDALQK
ncbi:hypothetical protein HYDPIDRAFT_109098 [Hydnomerulius pinastri MD-312]|nr:hypothetical protein HYDPIDRAFT_109098 [Hydnomerulius pinastri MD-312]